MGRAGSAGAGGMEAAGHRLPRELCCAHRRRLAKIAEGKLRACVFRDKHAGCMLWFATPPQKKTDPACQLASAAHLRCISTCGARVFVRGGSAREAGLATAARFFVHAPGPAVRRPRNSSCRGFVRALIRSRVGGAKARAARASRGQHPQAAMAAAAVLTSAAGVVALLDEPAPQLKVHALRSLDALVDRHWAEISAAVTAMYVARGARARARIYAARAARAARLGAPSLPVRRAWALSSE